jgi:DNA invertase Pin-like site-specific DNA recombinase
VGLFYLIYPSQKSAYRLAVAARLSKTRSRTTFSPARRLIGYARVSTGAQDLSLQLEALQQQGCRKGQIFIDKGSGKQTHRPGLDACLAMLQSGDVLLVWRLDRLGRSMPHLVSLITTLRERGVGFRSLCDGVIDTTTASGELVFTIFSALAQFEQRLIQERTRAGLKAARARGHHGGRKPLAPDDPRVTMAKTMHKDTTVSISAICRTLHISRATFYRYLSLAAKLSPSL